MNSIKRSCSLRWPLRRKTAASEAERALGPNISGSGVLNNSCHTMELLSSGSILGVLVELGEEDGEEEERGAGSRCRWRCWPSVASAGEPGNREALVTRTSRVHGLKEHVLHGWCVEAPIGLRESVEDCIVPFPPWKI